MQDGSGNPFGQKVMSNYACLQYGSTEPMQSSSTVLLFRHEDARPYAQTMANDERGFGFGARLRAARERVGLTGAELGKGAGENGKDASKASVSDWEHERHYPKADQLRVICLKLNIAVDDLIFGDIKEHIKVVQAESAIQALTPGQRLSLLEKMLNRAHAVSDGRVEEVLPPTPHDPLHSDFGQLGAGLPVFHPGRRSPAKKKEAK